VFWKNWRRNCFRAGVVCLIYSGFSALARELIYRDSPLANWMGRVNSFLTFSLVCANLGFLSFLGPACFKHDSIDGAVWRILARPLAGFAAGGIVHFAVAPGIRLAFREYRLCYYIMPLIAAGAGIWLLLAVKTAKNTPGGGPCA
jgi:hypothetical protein